MSEPFHHICAKIFLNSEAMRATCDPAQYVEFAAKEGRLIVELLLLILTHVSTPDFNRFLRGVSEPANLGDKLRDAKRDHALGEIAIQPGLRFHARLGWAMLWRTFALATSCLGNVGVILWGLKAVFTELIWFRHSATHSR